MELWEIFIGFVHAFECILMELWQIIVREKYFFNILNIRDFEWRNLGFIERNVDTICACFWAYKLIDFVPDYELYRWYIGMDTTPFYFQIKKSKVQIKKSHIQIKKSHIQIKKGHIQIKKSQIQIKKSQIQI